MSTQHQNMDERITELERLVKQQAKLIEQLRNTVKAVKSSHNNSILRNTAVSGRR